MKLLIIVTLALFPVLAGLLKADPVKEKEAPAETKEEKEDPFAKTVFLSFSQTQADYNCESDQFISAVTKVLDSFEGALNGLEGRNLNGRLMVQFTTKGTLLLKLETEPEMKDEEIEKILGLVAKEVKFKTKIFPMQWGVLFQVGNAPVDKRYGVPLTQFEEVKKEVAEADLAQSGKAIQNYARNYVLPVIAEAMSAVDPKFEGVVTTGQRLKKLDLSKKIDVEKFLSENVNYWRGMLEMAPGNPVVVLTRIALHAANGNFDHARRYHGIHGIFAKDENASTELLNELGELMTIHQNRVLKKINAGIALHDAGKFDEAGQAFGAVLKDYPYSAFAAYEVWFSSDAKKMAERGENTEGWAEERGESWAKASETVFSKDPMYPIGVHASTPEEMFSLMHRLELKELLNEQMDGAGLLEYATHGLFLGVYSFAAELNWLVMTHLDEKVYEGFSFPARAFYCIHEAGGQELGKLLNYDHEKAAKEVAAERAAAMEAFRKDK